MMLIKSLSSAVSGVRIYAVYKFLPLALITVIFLILALLSLRNIQLGQPADDAIYLDLANSMSQGHGLRHISLLQAPPDTWFPMGWPIILSLLPKLLPGNLDAARYLTLFFVLVDIFFVYTILGRYGNRPLQIAVTALFSFSPAIVLSAGSPMSEPAYITFSFLSLLLLEASLRKQRDASWLIILTAISIAFSIMIRSIGYALFAAAVLWLLWKRKPKLALLLGIVVVILLLPQYVINHQVDGGAISSSYQKSIDFSLVNIKDNILGYINEPLPNLIFPIFGTRLGDVVAREKWLSWLFVVDRLASLGLLMTGFLVSVRKLKSFHVYTIFYVLFTLVYKNPVSGSVMIRYLIPILPFLLLSIVEGIMYYWNIVFSKKAGRWQEKPAVLYGFTAILLCGFFLFILKDITSPSRNRMTDLQAGTVWISENTPADSIVMSRDPIPRHLYTRRTMTDFFQSGTTQVFESMLRQWNVRYVLISPELNAAGGTALDDYLSNDVLPWIANDPLHFHRVYRDDINNVTIFEFKMW